MYNLQDFFSISLLDRYEYTLSLFYDKFLWTETYHLYVSGIIVMKKMFIVSLCFLTTSIQIVASSSDNYKKYIAGGVVLTAGALTAARLTGYDQKMITNVKAIDFKSYFNKLSFGKPAKEDSAQGLGVASTEVVTSPIGKVTTTSRLTVIDSQELADKLQKAQDLLSDTHDKQSSVVNHLESMSSNLEESEALIADVKKDMDISSQASSSSKKALFPVTAAAASAGGSPASQESSTYNSPVLGSDEAGSGLSSSTVFVTVQRDTLMSTEFVPTEKDIDYGGSMIN